MSVVCLFVCLELSSPKPLDQSKNVTVRSYHKLSKDQKDGKKGKKDAKMATNANQSLAPCSEAGRSVVTSISYFSKSSKFFQKKQ